METLNQRPELKDFVTSVAHQHEIQNFLITNVKTNAKGEGFMGQIFIITIQDETSNKKLEMVVKASFVDQNIRKALPIKECFQNEIYFYEKVYPSFKKFQQVQFVPKCYKTLIKEEKEYLCLENLNELSFETTEKTGLLDHEHISMIFEAYGRFHAYSFALQDQDPEQYTQFASKLHDIFEISLDSPNGRYKSHIRSFHGLVQKFLVPGKDDLVIEKFEKYKGDGIVDMFANCVSGKEYSVILHGDCWSNNIMFKYEKSGSDKKLVDLRLLDFQFTRVGSPICDLSYCLYSGASKVAFDRLDQYLKIYHESLSSVLKQLGSDPVELFPFSALSENWKKYAKWGMIMAFAIWKMKTTKREDLLDLTDLKDDGSLEMDKVNYDEEEYSKRVRDILYHMSEIDAL